MNTTNRRDTLQALRTRGLAVPDGVSRDLEKAIPGPDVRRWNWWSAVWERPKAADWPYNAQELAAAQASWDTSRKHVDGQNAASAELERRKQQEREGREQQDATRRAAELETLTAELRAAYLASPGTTEDGFQLALPELLEQRARQAALAGTQSQANANVRSVVRYV